MGEREEWASNLISTGWLTLSLRCMYRQDHPFPLTVAILLPGDSGSDCEDEKETVIHGLPKALYPWIMEGEEDSSLSRKLSS